MTPLLLTDGTPAVMWSDYRLDASSSAPRFLVRVAGEGVVAVGGLALLALLVSFVRRRR